MHGMILRCRSWFVHVPTWEFSSLICRVQVPESSWQICSQLSRRNTAFFRGSQATSWLTQTIGMVGGKLVAVTAKFNC